MEQLKAIMRIVMELFGETDDTMTSLDIEHTRQPDGSIDQ